MTKDDKDESVEEAEAEKPAKKTATVSKAQQAGLPRWPEQPGVPPPSA